MSGCPCRGELLPFYVIGGFRVVLYYLYEMNHAALAPWRAVADAGISFWRSPANPLATTQLGRSWAASLELFERTTRRYGKPEFGITDTIVDDDHMQAGYRRHLENYRPVISSKHRQSKNLNTKVTTDRQCHRYPIWNYRKDDNW